MVEGPILRRDICIGGCDSGGLFCCSVSFLHPKDGRPNRRSREPPLPVPGGGGKEGFTGGSGDGLWTTVGVILGDGVEKGARLCSKAVLIGRCWRLLGGLYGGGGGGGAETGGSC